MATTTINEILTTLRQRFPGKSGITALANHLKLTVKRTKALVDGKITRTITLSKIAPRLAVAIGMDRKALIEAILKEVVPDKSNNLGRLMVTALAERGLDLSDLSRATKIEAPTLMRYIYGSFPAEAERKTMASWLQIPEKKLTGVIQETKVRRQIATRELEDIDDRKPLSEWLMEAIDQTKCFPTVWARKNRLRPATIHELIRGQQKQLNSSLVVKLARILKTDEAHIRAGLRLNSPVPCGTSHAIQQKMIERMGSSSIADVAKESNLSPTTLSAVVKHADISLMRISSIRLLCNYLEITQTQFAALASEGERRPLNSRTKTRQQHTMDPVNDDSEVTLLRAWRKASPTSRTQAMDALLGSGV